MAGLVCRLGRAKAQRPVAKPNGFLKDIMLVQVCNLNRKVLAKPLELFRTEKRRDCFVAGGSQ